MNTQALINETADVLRQHSPELADAWTNAPTSWKRIDLAHAVAAGYVSNGEDDVHPVASVVLRAAYLLREAA